MTTLLLTDAGPPRLLRWVCLQLLALAGVAILSELSLLRAPPRPVPLPAPAKEERRIRVVQLPKPPPTPAEPPRPIAHAEPTPPATAHAERPAPATPRVLKPPAPPVQPAPQAQPAAHAQRPAPPRPSPQRPSPQRPWPQRPSPQRPSPPPAARSASAPLAIIAADSTAVQGVRLRVLVPRSPADLAAHLRNSGGCLVVSRLSGGGAEVLSVLALDGQRAVETSGPPCNGVPRLLRDPALNAALGDPLGRARAALSGAERSGELALQVLLTPRLHELAQGALHARFGNVSESEMGRRAADSGYELTCFAEPSGSLRCN